jgi:hypothetical protein
MDEELWSEPDATRPGGYCLSTFWNSGRNLLNDFEINPSHWLSQRGERLREQIE